MKLRCNKGYSMIEIAIGLILITIFLISIYMILNSSYSNYKQVEQRDVAVRYAVKYVEQLLATPITALSAEEINGGSDIAYTTSNSNITEIFMPYAYADVNTAINNETPSVSELNDGNYAVPVDFVVPNTGRMIVTVKLRRLPGSLNNGLYTIYDSGLLIASVDVQYKIKSSDSEYKTFTLRAIKITKEADLL